MLQYICPLIDNTKWKFLSGQLPRNKSKFFKLIMVCNKLKVYFTTNIFVLRSDFKRFIVPKETVILISDKTRWLRLFRYDPYLYPDTHEKNIFLMQFYVVSNATLKTCNWKQKIRKLMFLEIIKKNLKWFTKNFKNNLTKLKFKKISGWYILLCFSNL